MSAGYKSDSISGDLIKIIVVWLLANFWHSFFFGFYSDDWVYSTFCINEAYNKLDLAGRIHFYLTGSQGRPILAFAYFATSFLSPLKSPLYWQLVNSLYVLISALVLWLFGRELLRYMAISTKYAAVASVIWLLSPWMLGSVSWSTTAPTLLSMIFFAMAGYYFFRSENQGRRSLILPSIFILLSSLSYEAFYFQYLAFPGVFYIVSKNRKASLKILTVFTLVQLLPLIWNRISPFIFTNAIHKTFNPYWHLTFVANVISLPYALIASCSYNSAYLLVILIFLVFVFIHERNKIREHFKRYGSVIVLLALCIIISMGIYAIAGYTVWGMGSRGRTLLTAGFWIPLMAVVLYSPVSKLMPDRKNMIVMVYLALVFLGIAQFQKSSDWIRAWRIQKAVIANLPTDKINSTSPDAVIIADLPFRYNDVSLFDTFWTINNQLNYGAMFCGITHSPKPLNRSYALGKGIIHPVNNTNWVNKWTGNELIQHYTNNYNELNNPIYNPQTRTKASEAWFWQFESFSFTKIETGHTIVCNPVKNYDYWLTWLWAKYFKGK